MEYDLLIQKGKIINGSGNPWFQGDLAVKSGKICKMGVELKVESSQTIDASNLVVSPGFMDMHTHSDITLPFFPDQASSVHQGVTTQVIGQCGSSLAPIPEGMEEIFARMVESELPEGLKLNINWHSFAEYLDNLDSKPLKQNFIPFVGYSAIRFAGGLGFENRTPTNQEYLKMHEAIGEAMRAGAFGMSTGIQYPPQVFASTDELIQVTREVAKYGGYYYSHIRNESHGVLEAVEEAIQIIEKSGCMKGQISHHKIQSVSNKGKSKLTLELINKANQRGVEVMADLYPFLRIMSSLDTSLPPWVHEGGRESVLERISNQETQNKIRIEILQGIPGWENWIKDDGFDNIFLATLNHPKWTPYLGKSINEITPLVGTSDDWETYFQILIDNDTAVSVTVANQNIDDLIRIMKSPFTMFGSDGGGLPVDVPLGSIHPRFFGTFPKIFGEFVRERKVLSIEEAVRKSTSLSFQRFGIFDRGLLIPGNKADITIFDPHTICNKSTYLNPSQTPTGIHTVIVNGQVILENGEITDKTPGKVIRFKPIIKSIESEQ